MAEETPAAPAVDTTAVDTTTVDPSPVADEAVELPEESAPNTDDNNNNLTDAPPEEEEKEKETVEDPAETAEVEPSASDHKRKLEDLEAEGEKVEDEGGVEGSEKKGEEDVKIPEPEDAADAKRQRVDDGGANGLGADGGQDIQKEEAPSLVGNGQLPDAENIEPGTVEAIQSSTEGVSQQGSFPAANQLETTRRIEVPNNKVGVLIGKAGETIRLLQNNSGARIQITRDAESDPNSSSRPVELTGSVENINKAEHLIKNVIAEADAGGSPALVARGFGATQSGSETYELKVPNEKVGLIIGKGGENIKTMQTKSHARIQLIPQHLPEGDFSKERTVRITGTKKQIEEAKSLIKEVMNQTPGRPSNVSGGHTGYRPRGHGGMPQWGPRGPPPVQSQMQPNSGYDYPQRGGGYAPQTTQYPQQSYGSGHPQQAPPRNNWEQRPAGPAQIPGGYDYYGQGQAMGMGAQSSNPASVPSSAPVSYNYGQPQGAGYGQSNPYSQTGPLQQGYGQGYNDPKYDYQAPTQQMYGQQQPSVSSQPGFYPQQGNATSQAGYAQQPPYGKPAAYAGAPQSYGPARATQPTDPAYQGSVQSSYGPGGPTQQSYPYGSSAPSPQPAPAYGQNYGPTSADGYNQPPSAGYSQPSSQAAPGYGQAGQPVPAYTQPGAPSGGYGQYPSAQPAYGEQPASNVNYGYQGGAGDGGYGNSAPASGYGGAPGVGAQPAYGQAGVYGQPSANSAAYDQSMTPQAGYGSHPGSAPVGYAKGVSPQPGAYAGQY